MSRNRKHIRPSPAESSRTPMTATLWKNLQALISRVRVQPKRRTLQVVEVAPLGEKRFVAVVSVGRDKFLIGGAATSVSLLTKLGEPRSTSSEPLRMPLPEQVAL